MPSADAGLSVVLLGIAGLSLLAVGFIGAVVLHHRSRVSAERERVRIQALLLQAARAGGLALWAWEAGPDRLTLSDSAAEVLGAVPLGLDGLLALLDPASAAQVRAWILEGGETLALRDHVHRDGAVWDTQWELRRSPGRLEGVIRDVREETRLQAELLQSQKQEALGTLVGGVSHEFGNLLMTVEACVEGLVRDESLPQEQRQASLLIEDAAVRGKELIRQLMAFARRGPGEVRPQDPRHLLEELARMLGPLFGRRVPLEVEALEPDLPALEPCPMNRAQVLQALLNLCLNARDAMPEGGRIRLRARRIGSGEGRRLALEVEDQGPGVAPEIQARIFEPFFTTKEAGRGTGLGLAVTHSIVEAHGGALQCESPAGGGALFRICLPYPEEDAAGQAAG